MISIYILAGILFRNFILLAKYVKIWCTWKIWHVLRYLV